MDSRDSSRIRTRFAPSPTGFMHIGNLRTALYAYLLARHGGGKFILRIEDTDQARGVEGAVDVIYESLRITGLHWDEGPDIGGPVGPYVQSRRKEIYHRHAEELLAKGSAYRCFCDAETLDRIRREAEARGAAIATYDGRCGGLAPAAIQARLDSGDPFVIRQRINRSAATTFHDQVFGDITIAGEQLDDQILLKRDGFPTYNFANVVDDHLMGITHVMRGVEYLSSTPKYMQLYAAFGWDPPLSIHLPHILGPSGRKLSKREGAAALQDFLEKGYLPAAILNYVALLGWSPGDDTEYFTLGGLVERFEVARINKASGIFDEAKLRHLNGLHLKAMSPESFHEIALRWVPDRVREHFDTRRLCALIQTRVETLAEIPELTRFLEGMPESADMALYEHRKMKTTVEGALPVLEDLRQLLEGLPEWDPDALHQLLSDYASEKALKNGQVLWPLRVALTGLPSSPGGAVDVAGLLGRTESLARLARSIEDLKGFIHKHS